MYHHKLTTIIYWLEEKNWVHKLTTIIYWLEEKNWVDTYDLKLACRYKFGVIVLPHIYTYYLNTAYNYDI